MRGNIIIVLMALSVNYNSALKVEDLVNPWPGCPLGPQGLEDDVKLEVADDCNQFIHCESYGRPQLKICAPSKPALVFDGSIGDCVWPWESNRDCSGLTETTTIENHVSETTATTEKDDTCNVDKTTSTTTEKTTVQTTTPTTPSTTTVQTTTPTTPSTTTVQTTTPTTQSTTTVQTTTPTTPSTTTAQTTTPTTTTSCPIVTCPPVLELTCPELTCPHITCPEVTCPTCPPPEKCPELPNGCDTFFYEHEKSCRKYYECKPKERTCPSKLHFNPKTKMCDRPQNVVCSGKKYIYDLLEERENNPNTMIYSDGSEPFPECPEEIDESSSTTVLEIKNDCHHYMMCVGNKKGIKKECPVDFVFDQKKNVCIFRNESKRTDC